jgi:hypothetical protein
VHGILTVRSAQAKGRLVLSRHECDCPSMDCIRGKSNRNSCAVKQNLHVGERMKTADYHEISRPGEAVSPHHRIIGGLQDSRGMNQNRTGSPSSFLKLYALASLVIGRT